MLASWGTGAPSSSLKHLFLRGVFWRFIATYACRLVSIASTLILARLLSPDEFGIVGYALVLLAALEVLGYFGILPALVYHIKEPAAADTAFFVVLVAGVFVFSAGWLSAPMAAGFFGEPDAASVMRTIALAILLGSLGAVPEAVLQSELRFKEMVVPDLASVLVRAVTAISFAVHDFAEWSIVYAHVAGTLAWIVGLWVVCPWRPSGDIRLQAAERLLHYAWPIVASRVVLFLHKNSGHLVVGRLLDTATMGAYALAWQLARTLLQQPLNVVGSVLFPSFAKLLSHGGALKSGVLKSVRFSALAIMPLGIGLAFSADAAVRIALGPKWLESVPVIQAVSSYMAISASAAGMMSAFKALGRPALVMYLALLRLTVLLVTLFFVTQQWTTLAAIGWSHVPAGFVHVTISFVIMSRVLKTSMTDFFIAIRPALCGAVGMSSALCVLSLYTAGMAPLAILVSNGIVGGTAFVVGMSIFDVELVRTCYRQSLRRNS